MANVRTAPTGTVCDDVTVSLSLRWVNFAGRRPLIATFVTRIACVRSSVYFARTSVVVAMMVARPSRRLAVTLYVRSSSYRDTRYPRFPL